VPVGSRSTPKSRETGLTGGPNTLSARESLSNALTLAHSSTSSTSSPNWWVRHVRSLKTVFRVLLGVAWFTDGILKFTSGFVNSFLGSVQASQANAPSWLAGWFNFWTAQATANSTLIVYTVGVFEVALGLALLFGFMRKISYLGGVVLGLLIWAVPEGFGGPYQTGAGGTDVGAGIIYAIAFLGLIVINAMYGPSRYSLDYYLERRFPRWVKVAEFGAPAVTTEVGASPPAAVAPST
jgi:uncharacterized membrane protein YphA (DoxX/SURF4 family)